MSKDTWLPLVPPPPSLPSFDPQQNDKIQETSFGVQRNTIPIFVLGMALISLLVILFYKFFNRLCPNLNIRSSSPSSLLPSSNLPTNPNVHGEEHNNEINKQMIIALLSSEDLHCNILKAVTVTQLGLLDDQLKRSECVVCLSAFDDDKEDATKSSEVGVGNRQGGKEEEEEKEQLVLLLNACGHVFHLTCIQAWLQSNNTCPLCRLDVFSDLRSQIPSTFDSTVPFLIPLLIASICGQQRLVVPTSPTHPPSSSSSSILSSSHNLSMTRIGPSKILPLEEEEEAILDRSGGISKGSPSHKGKVIESLVSTKGEEEDQQGTKIISTFISSSSFVVASSSSSSSSSKLATSSNHTNHDHVALDMGSISRSMEGKNMQYSSMNNMNSSKSVPSSCSESMKADPKVLYRSSSVNTIGLVNIFRPSSSTITTTTTTIAATTSLSSSSSWLRRWSSLKGSPPPCPPPPPSSLPP